MAMLLDDGTVFSGDPYTPEEEAFFFELKNCLANTKERFIDFFSIMGNSSVPDLTDETKQLIIEMQRESDGYLRNLARIINIEQHHHYKIW